MQKKNIIFLLLLVFYIYFYISGTYGAEWTTKNIFPPSLKLVKKKIFDLRRLNLVRK